MLDFLSASVYEFVLRALEEASLPPYKGNTQRGVQGHALRKATRTTGQRDGLSYAAPIDLFDSLSKAESAGGGFVHHPWLSATTEKSVL